MLKESNVRKGFFEHEQFLAVRSALPEEIRPIVTFAYRCGWRKGEILNLTWDKVDLKQGVVRLDPGETKNDEARMLYMDEELWKEMRVLHSKRRLGCPYVFQRNGVPIRDFRDSWDTACTRAKVDGRFLHDFRRTAVRNMVRAGVPEGVAMKITGHKTRSVFDRYNIVSDEDLKDAARKLKGYLDQRNTFPTERGEKGHVIPLRQAKNE